MTLSGNVDALAARVAGEINDVRGELATHAAASNPHPVYLTQTEADALYQAAGGGGGGTVWWPFPARLAELRTTTFPQLVRASGTNIPVAGYAFDAATEEAMFFDFPAVLYGSGNLTVWVDWYADTATSGVVRWSAQIAAITPDTDTQDVETDALATAATVDDTHLGTTGQRLHRAIVTVSALDSLAAGDDVRLRIARAAAATQDTMTGDAICTRVTVSYSST